MTSDNSLWQMFHLIEIKVHYEKEEKLESQTSHICFVQLPCVNADLFLDSVHLLRPD